MFNNTATTSSHCHLRVLLIGLVATYVFAFQISRTPAQTKSPKQDRPEAEVEAAAKSKFGDDTPEGAVRSFFTALAEGDAKTARHLLISPEKMNEWIKVQIDMSNAFRHFSKAAISKFGEEGKALQLGQPASLSLKKLDDIKPTQSGEKAEWRTNPNLPLKMVRVDGHWKIDLSSSFAKPEDISLMNSTLGAVTTLVDKIASEMEQGKYQSVAEVRAEMKRQRAKTNDTK